MKIARVTGGLKAIQKRRGGDNYGRETGHKSREHAYDMSGSRNMAFWPIMEGKGGFMHS